MWKLIDGQSEEILQLSEFADISFELLKQILMQDTLYAREVTVVRAVKDWACAEMNRRSVPQF